MKINCCFEKALQKGITIKKLYDDSHIAAYSAEAAFFVLVSAVPLVMFAVILAGALAPLDIMGIREMLSAVFTEKISGQLAAAVKEIVSHSTVPLASVTMVFLLWAATKGVRSIGQGIDAIYKSEDEYNIVQLTIRSVLYTLVMVAACFASLAVLVFASPLENLAEKSLGSKAKWLLVLLNMRNIIFFITFTLLFAFAYNVLAKSSLGFRSQLPGAAFAAAGWLVYSFGYSVYIKYFSNYSVLYGSFGAVMLFMLWLYMCMNILLCGALLNKIIYNKKCD
ncbi:MAG: YihY/virulence factor BrkB family protein [Oscillospiraceae bacterium]|nr:YihY/virulence factor BrkB family protein [Oscillospiraceae bacterium]